MRHEFSKQVKRDALRRAGGLCEAVGEVYGLPAGLRCNWTLAQGVEFDHYPVPATERGSDTLQNCVAVCPLCHGRKTAKFDIPAHAKVKRVQDAAAGIRRKSRLGNGNNQHTATRPIVRKSDRTIQHQEHP